MGANKKRIKYIDLSGFIRNLANLENRGNAALIYGALEFLKQKGLLENDVELIYFHKYNNFFKRKNVCITKETFVIDGSEYKRTIVPIHTIEYKLVKNLGIILPFTYFGRYIKNVILEAADFGGDGFSDIYGERAFMKRMSQTWILRKADVPLLMLPQTIGPFKSKKCYDIAVDIMRYAKEIYVRDDKFISEFDKLGIKYLQTKDISSLMKPEPWDIDISPMAVGLNVSGLAYSNTFNGLEGQFSTYPKLIECVIDRFREKGCTVYLIPHSYGYTKPIADDDMIACRKAYQRLKDKRHVVLVDKDMTAPQVKYLISRMTFFIGARMHANFAAIYTGVPVFGTSYSYKFEGAFNANGLDGKSQTGMINNLKEEDIEKYIQKILAYYQLTNN